jgi:hypothetical protein
MLIYRQNSYAASGALVAVKRRTVEPANKVKILPVLPTVGQQYLASP